MRLIRSRRPESSRPEMVQQERKKGESSDLVTNWPQSYLEGVKLCGILPLIESPWKL